MNLFELDLYKEVESLASEKGYTIEVEIGASDDPLGLAHHYVDYQNKKIEIVVPEGHPEIIPIFAHELFHAILFLRGFPRLLRSPEIQYNELDEFLAQTIEDRAHHYYLYPLMKERGYMYDEENKAFAENLYNAMLDTSTLEEIDFAFNVLEMDYRDPVLFQDYEQKIKKKTPNVYALYRRFKRLYSTIKDPRTMRESILKVCRQVESSAGKYGVEYSFKEKFNVPMIPNDYEKGQLCSKYLIAKRLYPLKHQYIFDINSGQCVKILDSSIFTDEKVKKILDTEKLNYLFN
ncbi:hypothetical protein [Bacillus cereus group sp. BfR-BA-01524]|uniref:hypothetical protein n=1 Tax=Bacillus cereus group sp. BfR-BA-01524 TaxID=2920372 RepID=UPI001F589987